MSFASSFKTNITWIFTPLLLRYLPPILLRYLPPILLRIYLPSSYDIYLPSSYAPDIVALKWEQ